MKCCICGKNINGHGHNPWPLVKVRGKKCCDECAGTVIEERIRQCGVVLAPTWRCAVFKKKGASK